MSFFLFVHSTSMAAQEKKNSTAEWKFVLKKDTSDAPLPTTKPPVGREGLHVIFDPSRRVVRDQGH